ncbi:hypothetical protein ACTFIN_02310 [Clostridium cagae]|nr:MULTISPECIES: hypothetical protein [Clostridium]AIY80368.1 hypothetical protein U728_2065 [Clostridium botulinum 202F]KAI3347604.1 hypothetical protein CIT17_04965 [Clostridium botulinum]MBY6779311.1 hypothetical protein [Clostridium botulinum]MBY6802091.1 hypothetical protein [Clostridium botulinum]MBY6812231.1 hypothetical protein [Clostridium botulinum]
MKKNIVKIFIAKFYNFFYFMFWGFYFSARYFFCKKLNSLTLMSAQKL